MMLIGPTGTQLIYGTYLAGTWGATPTGIAVDADGNAILAGPLMVGYLRGIDSGREFNTRSAAECRKEPLTLPESDK
jgi:hypothetical protein